MDAKTEQMIVTVGAGIIKKVLMLQAAGLVSHGLISSNNTEVFVSLGMAAVGAAWSFWQDFGKVIVLSQLEVLKAKSLAQAEKMRAGGMSPVTVNQIAMKTTMSASEVTAVAATLPAEVKVNIAPVIVKILLVLFLPLALVRSDPAMAQLKLKPLTGNIVRDLTPAPSVAKDTSNIMDATISALSKPFTDIANFIGSDAAQAVALSTVVPELQDGHGQMCWQAMSTFGSVIKAHPVPITLHVMFDYETLRLLAIATNQLCTNVHCTQVFADASSMAQAASPMPLVIPTLHDLCTKVPQIALVPPLAILPTPAAPTPAPQ